MNAGVVENDRRAWVRDMFARTVSHWAGAHKRLGTDTAKSWAREGVDPSRVSLDEDAADWLVELSRALVAGFGAVCGATGGGEGVGEAAGCQ
jgi:hypothetical protein